MKENTTPVPNTPLKESKKIVQSDVQQTEEPIAVPTPMKDAMAMNTLAPTGSVEQPIEEDTGLMSNATQQIA